VSRAPLELILNADDFGLSREVNDAIQELLVSGRISSTTLIVNAPCTEDAVSRVKERDDLLRRVGLHLNLRQFQPLNPRLHGSPFVDAANEFRDFRVWRVRLRDKIRHFRDVVAEVDLQIRRFRELTGLHPVHVDSHGHLHTAPYLFAALLFSREMAGCRTLRLSRLYPCERKTPGLRVKLLLKHVFNRLLALRFATADCFVSLVNLDGSLLTEECMGVLARRYTLVEIMCHPGPEGEGRAERLALESGRFDGYRFVSYPELAESASGRSKSPTAP